MDQFFVRPMTIDDYAAVMALWAVTEGLCLREADSPAAIAAFLERNPGLSVVAVEPPNRIVGVALCGHDGRRGFLHHVAVEPRSRRRGVGRALVSACAAGLEARGIGKCHLLVRADNPNGASFWRTLGWSNRADVTLMSRAIGGAGENA